MADEKTNQAEETGAEDEATDDTQTVTAEQFEKLQQQLQSVTKAQQGSDKKVSELTEALKNANARADDAEKSAEQKLADRIASLETKNAEAEKRALKATQRSLATELLAAEGLKAPRFLDRLIGEDDEETQTEVQGYIEAIKERDKSVADDFAKRHGRKPADANGEAGLLSADELSERGKDPEWVEKNQDLIYRSLEALR